MMRLKQLWTVFPLPSKLKLVWSRLTSSRLATFYFVFTILHCLVQVGCQFAAHKANHSAESLLSRLVDAAGLQTRNFTLYDPDKKMLWSCWGIPGSEEGESCITIWAATGAVIPSDKGEDGDDDDDDDDDDGGEVSSAASNSTNQVLQRRQAQLPAFNRAVDISPVPAPTDNTTIASLQVVGLRGDDDNVVNLSRECVSVLRWPVQTLKNTAREDIVFVCFQFWVLGMSFAALLNESIPHIIAALLTHFLATMWSGYQLANTQSFRTDFLTLTVNGACRGVNLLPTYWKQRGVAEICILALNCLALVLSAFLSWKIVKVFGWATFRRIGADRTINGIYTIVLLMTVFLQLSLFFIVTTMALWIDQLCAGSIGKFARHMMLYRAVGIVIFIMLIPWLALGWFGVRKENKKMMYGFFGISIFLLGQWASAFFSSAWRLTFINWDFFAIMSIVAATLTFGVVIFGILCFRNFGQGLSDHLRPEEDLSGEDFERITKEDMESMASDRSSNASSLDEKIAFPPAANIVPVFNTPFGSVDRDPKPIKQVALRDFAPAAMVTGPKPKAKIGSPKSAAPERVLVGPARRDSTRSGSTDASDLDPFYLTDTLGYAPSGAKANRSRWSGDSNLPGQGKRWFIE